MRNRYSYDAWGKQTEFSNLEQVTNRGYTGHEHLPEFGLINMNARMYDPVLGRFLEVDPYVADNTWSQDFNRYSYARNNPLVYTDPNATVAWSGNLQPNIKTDVSLKTFFGRSSGESLQMEFVGDGFVVIQPYEEVYGAPQ